MIFVNYPVGEVISKGDAPFDFLQKAQGLSEKNFNGYIVLAVRGSLIEEGVLFFREGFVFACAVECLAAEKTLKGQEALDFFFNQTRGSGFFQVISLERSQVDLVTAFDEKLLLPKIDLKELPKMLPSAFSPRFSKPLTSKSVLEAYGLSELQ